MNYDYIAHLVKDIGSESIRTQNDRNRDVLNGNHETNTSIAKIENSESANRNDRSLRLAVVSRNADVSFGLWGKKFRNALRGNWAAKSNVSQDYRDFNPYTPTRNPNTAVHPSGLPVSAEDNDPFTPTVILPTRLSALITIHFMLTSPWYSASENKFGLIDNQCCVDSLTSKFMIRSTSWKGNMRTMLQQEALVSKNETISASNSINKKLLMLFGPDSAECQENEGEPGYPREGRLVFYPTELYGEGGEVICPHDPEKRTALNPIPYEVVPAGTTGIWRVLYFPFDLTGKSDANAEIAGDLAFLLENMGKVLTQYGFSAKKTIGWGLAKIVHPIPEESPVKVHVSGKLCNILDSYNILGGDGEAANEGDTIELPFDRIRDAVDTFRDLKQALENDREANRG